MTMLLAPAEAQAGSPAREAARLRRFPAPSSRQAPICF